MHMTGCHNRSKNWSFSPLKTVLGKLRNKYQSYYATYKTHTMTTHHGGTGHRGEDRDINSHIDITTKGDTGGIYIGPSDNNESINRSNTMLAFGGSEADGHLGNILPSSQANITILTREINSLQQWVKDREGQPVEGLDCIELELQYLPLSLRSQSTSTPAPTEPLEKWHTNTQTHYAPHRCNQIHCYRALLSSMDMIQQKWRNS